VFLSTYLTMQAR